MWPHWLHLEGRLEQNQWTQWALADVQISSISLAKMVIRMDLILENELWPNTLAGSRSHRSMRILCQSKEKVLGGQQTPGVHVACAPAVASSHKSIASSGPKDRYRPVNPVRQAQGSKSFNNNLDLWSCLEFLFPGHGDGCRGRLTSGIVGSVDT